MKPLLKIATVKNLLISSGAYYLAGWAVLPLALGFGKFTQGIIYSGDFEGVVVMPLVIHLPRALVAAGVGASVVLLVESGQPLSWAIFTALLYALNGFLGFHWARPPSLLDRVAETIGTLFPAVTCIVGGIVAIRRRATPRATQITPG